MMKKLVYKTSEEKFLKYRELLLVPAKIFNTSAYGSDNILCEEIHVKNGIYEPVGLIYSDEDMMDAFRSDVIVKRVTISLDDNRPIYMDEYYKPVYTGTDSVSSYSYRFITFYSPLSTVTAYSGKYLDILDDIIAAGPR